MEFLAEINWCLLLYSTTNTLMLVQLPRAVLCGTVLCCAALCCGVPQACQAGGIVQPVTCASMALCCAVLCWACCDMLSLVKLCLAVCLPSTWRCATPLPEFAATCWHSCCHNVLRDR
jgi:hypothetical protein